MKWIMWAQINESILHKQNGLVMSVQQSPNSLFLNFVTCSSHYICIWCYQQYHFMQVYLTKKQIKLQDSREFPPGLCWWWTEHEVYLLPVRRIIKNQHFNITHNKRIIVWVNESVFMDRSDVDKYRVAVTWDQILHMELFLISCCMWCAIPQIFTAVDNVCKKFRGPPWHGCCYHGHQQSVA
jgi:hypothetical protein